MLTHVKQDFIYGFKLKEQPELDVLKFCRDYQLNYACSGDYGYNAEAVIGIRLQLDEVMGEPDMGRGKAHPFSVDAFINSYREAKERLPMELIRFVREEGKWLIQEGKEPMLWTISYQE